MATPRERERWERENWVKIINFPCLCSCRCERRQMDMVKRGWTERDEKSHDGENFFRAASVWVKENSGKLLVFSPLSQNWVRKMRGEKLKDFFRKKKKWWKNSSRSCVLDEKGKNWHLARSERVKIKKNSRKIKRVFHWLRKMSLAIFTLSRIKNSSEKINFHISTADLHFEQHRHTRQVNDIPNRNKATNHKRQSDTIFLIFSFLPRPRKCE